MSADITPGMQQPPGNLPPPPPGTPPPDQSAQAPAVGTVTTDASGRRWYWDGTQWRPVAGAAPGRRNWRLVYGVVALIVFGIAYFAFGNHTSTQTISNTKIDSPTQIEFDYHASSNCSNLTFAYTFYDSSGKQVDVWNGESSHQVESGHDYHITASSDPTTGQAITSSATRFDVTPTCHDQ